jgi:CRISPR system Cascade subunit CasB
MTPPARGDEVVMTKQAIDRFITRLEALGGIAPDSNPDRSALAALRRSLATWPAPPPDAVRVVAPFLPEQSTGWWETVHYLVAGLFALHPCQAEKETEHARTLGVALRQATSGDTGQGPERRLLALLGCKSEDLPNHLRHAVSYLRARDVPINYRRLMQDLLRWDRGEGSVQRRWGRDFWAGTTEVSQQESKETTVEENSHVH